jgi:hypothetical protein
MARDKFHQSVREALEKDGWTITHDPFRAKFASKKYEIDIGAEKLIAANRGSEKIVVEIKSFLTKSANYEMHEAVGQFINYRRMLRLNNIEHQLFLAMPEDVFEDVFNDEFGQITIQEENIKILVFHPAKMQIIKWIK